MAARYGDRVAFHDDADGRGAVTFRDMARRAAAAARRLRDAGVGQGDRVAVLSRNRLELVDILLGCNRIGATLVPLNIRLAAPEVEALLADCRPSVVFASADVADLATPSDVPVQRIGRWSADDAANTVEADTVDAEDAAFILYTGGTTGTPKGAVIPWRAVLANADSTIRGWKLRDDDVTPLLFPLFHTGGWNVLTLPLYLHGASTVLLGPFDPQATLQTIERERCSIVIGVPTMFHAMADHASFATTDLSSVREFVSGGAPCPVPIMQRYWDRGAAFRVGYGLTEAGPNNFVIDAAVARDHPRSVGRPVPGVSIRLDGVADDAPGEGELLIRGDHVFAGYWQRRDATEEALRDGWLHTGDVARRDGDGLITVIDRLKDMYISGGENVYPVEVEQVIAGHPGVDLVAVIGVPDETWGEVGKAVVQPKPGVAVDAADIVRHARKHLAGYKVPKHVETVEALPVSPAGKILKKELRQRSGGGPA